MPRHKVTSDEIIRAEQKQEIILAFAGNAHNPTKTLIWYPYTQTYEVRTSDGFTKHTMCRSTAINSYNEQ